MRYFKINSLKNGVVDLSKEEYDHLFKVLRYQVSDQVNLFDQTHTYQCIIKNLNPLEVQVISSHPIVSNYGYKINLFLGIIKKPSFELALEKAVELGIDTIVPTYFQYSQRDLKYNMDRLNKIIISSQKQSNNFNQLIVKDPVDFKQAIAMVKKDDFNCVAYEKSEFNSLIKINIKPKSKTINLFIGPEGGISKSEMEIFKQNQFKIVKLTNSILRAETAAIYLISNILERLKDEKQ